MGQIPGERTPETRRPFHDRNGRHIHRHPADYARRSEMSGWERAYARHLDRHQELIDNPEPQEGDPPVVVELFEHIEHLRKVIDKEQQIIIAVRQSLAQTPEGDDKDLETLRRALREGGTGS